MRSQVAFFNSNGLSGQREKAQNLLQELEGLSKKQYVLPSLMVWIYAGLGDADKAFEWLKKCYQERDSWMWFFEHQSEFDLIRHDSRFREMLERLNLE